MAVSLVVMLVTGFMFWQPVVHRRLPDRACSALRCCCTRWRRVVLILAVIVHVYAAIWVKGTVRAMTRGTVTEGWARQNHALWHRKMTEGK